MLTAPLTFYCVCAARDRPDHERPGGRWEGPAAVPGHPPSSPTPSRLQIAQRRQRTPDQPFNGQQRLSRSGGRVPLQEMWQVSDQKYHVSRCCCVGDVGMAPFAYSSRHLSCISGLTLNQLDRKCRISAGNVATAVAHLEYE